VKIYDNIGNLIDIDESKELARGGEGRIIQVDNKTVAKLYLPGIDPITQTKFDSLSLIQSSAFVKPLNLLFDKHKKIIGFTMNMLDSEYFPFYSLLNSNFCLKHNIDDNFKHRVGEKLISSVKYLHGLDIVIGDLNPLNMMLNDSGALVFIDVDSYQTPGNPHSGRLLDDIRDYYYNGVVNKESDYFALAINLFNSFTYLHPYKGVHDKYRDIQDRMIHRIPVLDNDPSLKLPKCYKPLTDSGLIEQFNRIFKKGERFLFGLSSNANIKVAIPKKTIYREADLMIKEILENINIRDVKSSNNYCCVRTNDKIIILDLRYKGQFRIMNEIKIISDEIAFPTDNGVFLLRDNKIFSINGKETELKGYVAQNPISIKQYDNILVIIEKDYMYKIYLDDTVGDVLKIDVVSVYGRGFRHTFEGLIHNITGKNFIYYNKNNKLNVCKCDKILVDIYQLNNIGVFHYVENSKIKYCLFNVDNMNINCGTELSSMRNIAYKDKQFIIIPEDDTLIFLRPSDFAEIARFNCSFVSETSQVFNTNSGILLVNEKDIYLINKK
jgi:serine/threonine protein kinase